jgi:hypothetical protein
MKHCRRSAFLPLLLVLAACSGPASQKSPLPNQDVAVTSPDLARIYCVREEPVVGLFSGEISVLDGSTTIGQLTSSTYLCWERKAGRTLGRATYESMSPMLGNLDGLADFDCKAGKVYYFNISVRKQDGKPVIERLSEEQGRALVAKREWAGSK